MHPCERAYGLWTLAGKYIDESKAEYARQCQRDNLLVGVAVGGTLALAGLSVVLACLGV